MPAKTRRPSAQSSSVPPEATAPAVPPAEPAPDLGHIAEPIRHLAVPVGDLRADPANLRKHGERSIDGIKASLSRFGQKKPIVVDAAGVTIAGAGLLESARQLGWTHVAAVRDQHLTGVERVLYAIADNRTAELSSWDLPSLGQVMGQLSGEDFAAAGFTTEELGDLLASGEQRPDDVVQDEAPAVQARAVSRRGDLWILGEHRLLCGDCTSVEDLRRLMDGKRAVLFATDPPYLVDYDGTNHPSERGEKANKSWGSSYGKTWDDADANSDLYDRFVAAAIAEALTDRAAWYCWYASKRHTLLEAAWVNAGILPHCQIIWAKNRSVVTRTWYLWQHEPCLMGWKKGHKPERVKGQPMLSTLWEIPTIPNGDERPEHPTPKPLETFAIPMRQHTREGDVCFEAFSGSGTQIIVAEQLRRRCFATEIEPLYVDVAVRRWQKLTGCQAVLDGSGAGFDAVAAERLTGPA